MAKSEYPLVEYVGDALGAVFRHLVPGVLVLGMTAAVRNDWVEGFVSLAEKPRFITPCLVALAVLATAAGNAFWAFHRYFLQQFVDLAFWGINTKGGPLRKEGKYHSGVAKRVAAFTNAPDSEGLKKHLTFRNAGNTLLYTTAEIMIIGALLESTWSDGTKYGVLIAGVVIFLGAIWQNVITRHIEGEVGKSPASAS